MYDINMMNCFNDLFAYMRLLLSDTIITNNRERYDDKEEKKRITNMYNCLKKMKKMLIIYRQKKELEFIIPEVRIGAIKNYFDEFGKPYIIFKEKISYKGLLLINSEREDFFYYLMIYGINLVITFLEEQHYEKAYDCIDAIHAFPDMMHYKKRLVLRKIWREFIEPFRKKWGKNYFAEFECKFKGKL